MSAGSRGSLASDVGAVIRAVLRSPTRFRRLLNLGPGGLLAMTRFLGSVVPRATRVLAQIRTTAQGIPDPGLRAQALASIADKAYHVAGGCILATFLEREAAVAYVAMIAPLETIYDYLDNLCDRLADVATSAYPTLHEALLDVMIVTKGLTRYAAGNSAVIIRDVAGHRQEIKVRLSDLIKDGDIDQNVAMLPGDTLIIPQSYF